MGTILTCHNICFVTNVSLATLVAIDQVGPRYGELLSVVVVIPLLVIFGEVVPKSYCQDRADALAPSLARLIWTVRLLVYPINWLLSFLIGALVGVNRNPDDQSPFVTRQELEVLIEEPSKGDVRASERQMISRIFSFGEQHVFNVMVPLVEVSAVSEDETVVEVIKRFEKDGHSRILVYRDAIHQIVGFVNVRDIISSGYKIRGSLKENPSLIRQPYFVHGSKTAGRLLVELQQAKVKMAAIVDEYGGCVGVTTTEDLIEEMVGEIQDEFDSDEVKLFEQLGEKEYLVDARMEVESIREDLSIPIPSGNYETLGGYLLRIFERIPKPGEKLEKLGWLFTIMQASAHRIESVRCERIDGKTATEINEDE